MQETQEIRVRFPGQEETLEKGMATHSSIPAWETPWTEEPGRLQSMGTQRVGHALAHTFVLCAIPWSRHVFASQVGYKHVEHIN